jgi:AMP phosphorylase
VEEKLLFESFDKIIVSIIAKKVAFGSNHVVIDLPYGPTTKVHRLSDAEILSKKFIKLAKRFGIKIKVVINRTVEPSGNGIGPILEAKDALLVLEQSKNRPLDLEKKSLDLAAMLLEICIEDASKEAKKFFTDNFSGTRKWAEEILKSGYALRKMKEIIKAQGGRSIKSEDLKPGKYFFKIKASKRGHIMSYNLNNLTVMAKILGAPHLKGSGIYLNKKVGDKIEEGDVVCTLFSEKVYNLNEGIDTLSNFDLFEIE